MRCSSSSIKSKEYWKSRGIMNAFAGKAFKKGTKLHSALFWLVLCGLTHPLGLVEGSHIPQSYLRSSSSRKTGGESTEDVSLQYIRLEEDHDEESLPTSSTSSSTNPPLMPSTYSSSTEIIGPKKVGSGTIAVGADGKRYKEIMASCDSTQISIFSRFASPFVGRIYANGYPDEAECGISSIGVPGGENGENVTFLLPLGQCGVQMMAGDPEVEVPKRHEVTLYIQYSPFLQQAIDDKVSVSCVEVKKSGMEESIQIVDFTDPSAPSSRKARKMGKGSDPKTKNPTPTNAQPQSKISSKIGESWMEILHGKDPSPKSRKNEPVAVGNDVTLVISTKVIRGYDARIVNCSANDGSRLGSIDGFRSQQILDSAGCSTDTALVPNFRRRRLPIESRNRLITLHFASFQAFKFPEREHLHIKCAVAYCQGPCPHESCDSGIKHFGTWREKYGRIADALIDTTELVNSIQVYGPPELEDAVGGHHFERHQSDIVPLGGSATPTEGLGQGRQMRFSGGKSSEDSSDSTPASASTSFSSSSNGSVCVSPVSVIIALVLLGLVLVISATATLWFALKKSEANKYRHAVKHSPFQPQPYYRFSQW